MKYIFTSLLVIILSSTICVGQETKDRILYSQAQSLDTSITPDFYQVEIAICEYFIYSKGRRESKSTKISIDSVKQLLLAELDKAAVRCPITLSQVIDRDFQTYPAEAILKASFRFNIALKDSLEIIYKALAQNMPISSLRRFEVVPILSQITIRKVQAAMEKIALEKVTNDALQFAERNKYSIQKIENYEIEFRKKDTYEDYYFVQQKALNISYMNPVYTLNVKHTFLLK